MGEYTDIAATLLQMGGWGALLVVGIVIAVTGHRGIWAWGRDLDRERNRADRLLELLDRLSKRRAA